MRAASAPGRADARADYVARRFHPTFSHEGRLRCCPKGERRLGRVLIDDDSVSRPQAQTNVLMTGMGALLLGRLMSAERRVLAQADFPAPADERRMLVDVAWHAQAHGEPYRGDCGVRVSIAARLTQSIANFSDAPTGDNGSTGASALFILSVLQKAWRRHGKVGRVQAVRRP